MIEDRIATRGGRCPGTTGDHRKRPAEDEESRRRLDGAHAAANALSGAAQIILTGDRENDIYGFFVGRPAAVDFVVRAAQDRALDDGTCLKQAADAWSGLVCCTVAVAARPAAAKGGPQPARTARVEVRAGTITVLRPKSASRADPARITLGLVEVREIAPPAGLEPLLWRPPDEPVRRHRRGRVGGGASIGCVMRNACLRHDGASRKYSAF